MTRVEIKDKLSKCFNIRELVCPHIYARFGEGAWEFPDLRLLEVLLWIRNTLGKPITINSGTKYTQRGMRCNLCEEVKKKNYAYLSAHVLGLGIDFHVKDMKAEEVHQWLEDHKEGLPHNIRLERGASWVHLDIRNETNEKIIYFDKK